MKIFIVIHLYKIA